ncbi:hypothetical protein LI053_15105 [Clostridium perfringens]|uniref:hypothetical protein n=1 Tax=Clostridium perfringens TaxID=1502 RepID=UPI00224642FB|nr:hypothetical protein [Clostridium perfringens]MCX0386769.1 hypothetical protein [Clostridium perfringens]
MLNNKNIDIKGLYIGELKESNETILLDDLESNKNTNTLKVCILGIGIATHMNTNNRINQLP